MGYIYDNALSFKNDWIEKENVENSSLVSVVIPVYKPKHLKHVLTHLSTINCIDEVILIDDNSKSCESVNSDEYTFNLVIKNHDMNYGRSAARNTGVAYASGEYIVFMDQDMILAPKFVEKAIKTIIANKNKGVALGFRVTEEYESIPQAGKWLVPNRIDDWRCKTKVYSNFIDLTITETGSACNKCKLNEEINILELTDGFRTLGMNKNNNVGFWDLASMVISHSMVMHRNEIIQIGGFPEWIQGWGGEDIVVGFLAIANGCFVIPIDEVSYHIKHEPFSGSDQAKRIELCKNIKEYHKFASTVNEFPRLDEENCKKRCHEYEL